MLGMIAKFRKMNKIFLATVVAPTAAALLYFGLIASDVYVSESVFVVRRPEKPSGSSMGILLKTAGFSNASDEMYAAQSYVLSRDALRQLDRDGGFRSAYTRDSISLFDRFDPTGFFGSFEDLYQFYQKKIAINYDTTSSISTLTVRAYTSQDAQRINENLLKLTEATVNRLNQRGRRDLIAVAEAEVANAKAASQIAARALAQYRNRSGIIDPEKQAAVQMQMISKLQDQLIATNTQLDQLNRLAPANPQIPVLRTTVGSLSREIEERTRNVAGNRESLSGVAVEYQRLLVESQFADKQLAVTLASLSDAQSEARKQQAYIERISQPSLPDIAVEPRRLRGIMATFVLGLIAYGILSMLLAGMREHRD